MVSRQNGDTRGGLEGWQPEPFNELILGRGGGTPKLCQNICLLNICWYQNRPAP